MVPVLGGLLTALAALVLVVALAAIVLFVPPLMLAFWKGLVAVPEKATPRTDPYLDEPTYCAFSDHLAARRNMRWHRGEYRCTKCIAELEEIVNDGPVHP